MSIFRVVGAAAARVSDVIVGSASGTNSPVDDKTPRGRSRRRRSRSKKPAPLTVKRCNFIEPPTDVATLKSPVIPASATPFSEAGDDASRAERYDEVGDDASRAGRYDDASHSASDAESYDVESRSASEGSYDVHVSDADMDAVVGAYEEARAALEAMTERAAAAERVAADLEASLTGSRLELIAARTKLATPKKKKKRAVIGTKPKRVRGLSPEDAPMAWFAAAAVEQLPQTLYRCAGKSGGIVRAGVEKTSGALLKLAFGMEVVVDGAAAASDGTRRLRLSQPVVGWTSAKILERVCVAAVAQSAQGAMAIRSRPRLVALSDDLGAYAARDDAFHATGAHSRVFLDADGAIRAALAAALAAAPAAGDGSWSARAPGRRLSLNAKCRFLRYADGDSVQPHVDPAWDACDPSEGVDGLAPGARSWFTVIVYLNDGFRGGETTFFAPAGNGAYDLVSVAPRRGAALLFPHGAHRDSPLHEGSEVRGGSKHVLRTDVLYSDA
ncbi:hypothetical protein JL720_8468 [Aureococcus anophagefferens]|nr:hypothetical protein JL720_8468 [Aureococcus anophagefferens]